MKPYEVTSLGLDKPAACGPGFCRQGPRKATGTQDLQGKAVRGWTIQTSCRYRVELETFFLSVMESARVVDVFSIYQVDMGKLADSML